MDFSGGGHGDVPARSVCLVTLSPSEAGPGRFGRQASVTDICHAMPCHVMIVRFRELERSALDGMAWHGMAWHGA